VCRGRPSSHPSHTHCPGMAAVERVGAAKSRGVAPERPAQRWLKGGGGGFVLLLSCSLAFRTGCSQSVVMYTYT